MTGDYIAFISYRHRPLDTAVATRLHRLIEHYRVPRELRQNGQKTVGRVFRDRDELPLSSDLTAELREALDHSAFLIVICSPDTPQSIWVDREIEYFLRSHDRDHVLAVLTAGTQDVSFPKRLTEVYAEDGVTVVEQVEPLAANIADETNPTVLIDHLLPHRQRVLRRLNEEFLRLMAALLHCPYDTLRQRARQYRQRRALAALATVAVVVMAFLLMLLNRNREITRQMQLAQANEQRALASEAQAQQNAREAQSNESYALTLLSEQQLDNGDRRGALESALAALPDEDDPDRPYRVQAEKALADALYLYSDRQLRLAGAVELDVPPERLLMDGAGMRVFMADEMDGLACYTTNATLQWQAQLQSSLRFWALAEGDAQDLLICVGFHDVIVLDAADGAEVAHYEVERPDDTPYEWVDTAALAPDGHTLLLLYESDPAGSLLLVGLDVRDGKTCFETEFGQGPLLYYRDYLFAFSPDGALWALLAQTRAANTEGACFAFLLGQTADGALLGQRYFESEYSAHMDAAFTPQGDLLVIRGAREGTNDRLWVECYRPGQDAPLYSRQGAWPVSHGAYFSDGVLCFSATGAGSTALWQLEGNCFQVDAATGALTPLGDLGGTPVCQLAPSGALVFDAVLDNGTVVHATSQDLTGGVLWDAKQAVQLGAMGGDGVVQAFCLVFAQDPTRLVFCQPMGDDDGQLLAGLGWWGLLDNAMRIFALPDGYAAVIDDGDDRIAVYDPADWNQPLQSFSLYTYFDCWPVAVSADGARLLLSTGGESLNCDALLDRTTGEAVHMAETVPQDWQGEYFCKTASPLPLGAGQSLVVWLRESRKTADGYESYLVYWQDLGQAHILQPPEGQQFTDSVLTAGNNGWLAVGVGERVFDSRGSYLAYCLTDGSWHPLPGDVQWKEAFLRLAEEKPLLAALENGMLTVCDLAAGTNQALAVPGLARSLVVDARFLADDTLLLVLQSNGLVRILRLADGTQIFTGRLQGADRGLALGLTADPENGALYVMDASGTASGLCLDTASWQVRAEIPALLCCLPGARQLICRNPVYDQAYDLPYLYPGSPSNATSLTRYAPWMYPLRTRSEMQALARALLAP